MRAASPADALPDNRARYDAITLDARLRYYTALARTRALTEAEDEDRLHLLRCRLLRRLLPVRIAAGPAIRQTGNDRLGAPVGQKAVRRLRFADILRRFADEPGDLVGRHRADVDLVGKEAGDDRQRQFAGRFGFVSHAGLSAPARANGQ